MKKIILFFCCIFSAYCITAQDAESNSVENDSLKEKAVEFTVMPYVSYNRNLKAMFGVVPMLMYDLDKTDTISPPSISGVAGVYTTNKSYFLQDLQNFILTKIHGD